MMSFLTSIIVIFVLIIYVVMHRKSFNSKFFSKVILFVLMCSLSYVFVIKFVNQDFNNDVNSLVYESSNVMTGNIEDGFGTGRIYIWKQALEYFPDFIYTGVGIDNFAYLGYKHNTYIYDSLGKDTLIYKAHNEYLQILVTEGIFMLIVYLLFMGTIFCLSCVRYYFSYKKDVFRLSLMLCFMSYLIQAFFNIRILLIAPIFFMISGLLVSEESGDIL